MSMGFCRDNFDLNKNAIIENKKKDYWVLDLFDGEIYNNKSVQYVKFIQDDNLLKAGDIIGCQINLESGDISFFKNGQPLGTAF